MTRIATLKQVPQVPLSDNPALNDFLNAVKQCLEVYQGNIGDGSDVIARRELSDFENQNADWDSTDGGDEVYNKPTLGTAASRDAEDTLTNGSNLPDGAAIIAYGDANWSTEEIDNFRIGDETIEDNLWNVIGLDNDNEQNLTIYDLVNNMPWISAYRHGGVFLYCDGNRRLETTIDGVTITGDLSVTGGWSIDDFLIGTYTLEANSWNAIKVNGERNFVIWNDQEDEAYLSCYRNEGVFLYYNGVRILETAAEGIKLSNSDQSIVATIGPQTIEAATWQGFNIAGAANFCVYDADNTNSMIGAYRAAGVFLYYNGTKKFETTNIGIEVAGQIKITGGVPGASKVLTSDAVGLATWETSAGSCSCDDIDIGTFTIDAASWNALKIGGERNFTLYNDQEGEAFLSCYRNEGVLIYYNGIKKLETTNTGISVAGDIAVTGNVDGKDISAFGTAVSRDAEDSLTDGANLPDGAAIKTYGDANWGVGAALQNVVEDLSPELGANLYTNAFEIVFNNAKYLLFKDFGGSNRYGIGLTAGDDWQIARDADTVSIGYGCSAANPVMIRVNSTNDLSIERSNDTDGAGKHYLVVT